MMTEEMLKSMEASAPLLVAEVRRLQADLKQATAACETLRDALDRRIIDLNAAVEARDKALDDLGDYEELTEAIAVIVHAGKKWSED